jgi:hypothetical protein
MASNVRSFGARLVFELCEVYVRKIRCLIKFSEVKTIKPNTIECATSLILDLSDNPVIHAYVAERLALFATYKQQKKLKQPSAPDDGAVVEASVE